MMFRHTCKYVGLFVALLVLVAVSSPARASLEAAQAEIASGDYALALSYLDEIEADSTSSFLRGVALAELGRESDAEIVFRDLIAQYPDYPEPYNNLAVLLAGSGRFEEAVETLKAALRTHTSYGTVWDNLTTIYGRLASEAYSRALNVEGSVEVAPVKLALLDSLQIEEQLVLMPVAEEPPVEIAEMEPEPVEPESVALVEEPVEATVVEATVEEADLQVEADEPEEAALPDDSTEMADVPQDLPEPEQQVVEAVPVEEAVSGDEVVEEPADEVIEPVEQIEPEVREASVSPAELTAFVEAWAAAWAGQRPDEYLSYYADAYIPPDGMSLADWQAVRRSRLEAPEFIRVSIAFLDYEVEGEQARVVFNQSYESNTFSDLVTKTLTLAREDSTWKIVRETVNP